MEIVLLVLVIGGVAYVAIQNHKLRTQVPLGVNQIQKPLEVSVEILVSEYQSLQEKVQNLLTEFEVVKEEFEKFQSVQIQSKEEIDQVVDKVDGVLKKADIKAKHTENIDKIVREQMTFANEQFSDCVDQIKIHEGKINDIQSQLHKILTYRREERNY